MALTKITSDGITDGTVVNADINASAAIDGSKISPTFSTDATINSIIVGKGANAVIGNMVVGEDALDAAVTGSFNTGVGRQALTDLTSGQSNTAIGSGAANTYDSGFVTERGSSTNVALIWDESEDLFNFITTTDTGVTSGNINVSGQADIKTGSITSTGNIQLTGTLQFDSGQTVNEISDDTTLADGAATALVTENAIKTHVSAQASAFAIALG